MDVEIFFEAWVESAAADTARSGAERLRMERRQETRVPLDPAPPFSGSRRSLVPDLVLGRGDVGAPRRARSDGHPREGAERRTQRRYALIAVPLSGEPGAAGVALERLVVDEA